MAYFATFALQAFMHLHKGEERAAASRTRSAGWRFDIVETNCVYHHRLEDLGWCEHTYSELFADFGVTFRTYQFNSPAARDTMSLKIGTAAA